MREYGKVSPVFWTGKTGKAIKTRGSEATVVALYLMSSPHSNMLGLYYQPLLYMAHETGLGIEGASKGLQDCIEAGFCAYDKDSEMVWVYEMAAYQIADELKASDKRCNGIQKDYDALPSNPFLPQFFDRYSAAFHMTSKRGPEGATQAPPKAHRSQEQEQEQEQEQKRVEATEASEAPAADRAPAVKTAAQRGTRLPADWKLTVALAADGARARADAGLPPLTDAEMRTEGAKFRDHWHAKTGKDATKVDWPATWRNWCRNARKAGAPFSVSPPAETTPERTLRMEEITV